MGAKFAPPEYLTGTPSKQFFPLKRHQVKFFSAKGLATDAFQKPCCFEYGARKPKRLVSMTTLVINWPELLNLSPWHFRHPFRTGCIFGGRFSVWFLLI